MTTMFRGKTPESWCCVDCGVNTAPGHPNRKELEGLHIRSAVIKKLTGKETPVSAATFNDRCEIYTVRDTVWKTAGMEPMGGCLCVGCLEKRLDRRLRPKDFTRHPFNTMPGTKRLTERRTAGPAAMFDGTDMYVVFNGVRIAKRSLQAHTWVSLEPGYRVLDQKDGGIVVEYE